MRINTSNDFWSKVAKQGKEQCWPWLGHINTQGQAVFRLAGVLWLAHRLAYYLTHGHCLDVLMRKCSSEICCNPAHMHARSRMTTPENFWQNADCRNPLGCWEWRGTRDKNGYGRVSANYDTLPAHRLAYKISHGAIPPGRLVCHSCDNPPCINPKHLWLGTPHQNTSDAVRKKRHAHGGRVHGAVLTAGAVKLARNLYKHNGPYNMTDLAYLFGVKKTAMRNAIRHVTWRHLP